jgi:sugar O-acyltransferase (sialic acid O-acetyltransferase NeuD family)
MLTDTKTAKLLLVGSSGHASVLLDTIELAREYGVAGYLDDTSPPGTKKRGYPVLGNLAEAASICAREAVNHLVIAVGDNWWRRKIYFDLIGAVPDAKFPVVKHPSAVVAASAEIGRGAAILAQSHVGPASRVGEFCIVNTGGFVDHECTLHDFASLAPGVSMGGKVQIGECTAVGVGASISDRISIGKHTVIGAGAVVVRDVPDLAVAYGNPARVHRARPEGERYL